MDQHELPENYKEKRKKRILIRIILVVLSWVIFYYAYFHMPIPSSLKRAFTQEDCKEVGGTWDTQRRRCMQGGLKPKD